MNYPTEIILHLSQNSENTLCLPFMIADDVIMLGGIPSISVNEVTRKDHVSHRHLEFKIFSVGLWLLFKAFSLVDYLLN